MTNFCGCGDFVRVKAFVREMSGFRLVQKNGENFRIAMYFVCLISANSKESWPKTVLVKCWRLIWRYAMIDDWFCASSNCKHVHFFRINTQSKLKSIERVVRARSFLPVNVMYKFAREFSETKQPILRLLYQIWKKIRTARDINAQRSFKAWCHCLIRWSPI